MGYHNERYLYRRSGQSHVDHAPVTGKPQLSRTGIPPPAREVELNAGEAVPANNRVRF